MKKALRLLVGFTALALCLTVPSVPKSTQFSAATFADGGTAPSTPGTPDMPQPICDASIPCDPSVPKPQ